MKMRENSLFDSLLAKPQHPEFRTIEGFPVGDDEEILKLKRYFKLYNTERRAPSQLS